MARIFISYAREDFKPVGELRQRLKDAGFTPWMDKVDLIAGQRWRPAIERAIQQTDFFVICLSNHSVKKRSFVQREIKLAVDLWQEKLENDVYLIPVLLEPIAPEEIPDKLREVGWVFLYEEDGWDELLRALRHGMTQRAIEINAERKRDEEELRLRQEQIQQEEQRKAEERRASEAKERAQEERRQAEVKAREQAAAREREEQRQREAKARQEEENRQAEVRRQREAEARQEEARRQAEKERLAEEVRRRANQQRKEEKASERGAMRAQRKEGFRRRALSLARPAGVGALLVLLALIGAYSFWSRGERQNTGQGNTNPATQPSSLLPSSPPAPTNLRGEVLRYSLEIEGEERRATSLNLASGKPFRLHFTAPTNGYLYLLARDSRQALRTFLVAQQINADVDFTDDWITPDPKSQQGAITVLFSPERITSLSFLNKPAGHALTSDEEKAFKRFCAQTELASSVLINSAAGDDSSVVVTATKNGGPVVFKIVFESKRSGS